MKVEVNRKRGLPPKGLSSFDNRPRLLEDDAVFVDALMLLNPGAAEHGLRYGDICEAAVDAGYGHPDHRGMFVRLIRAMEAELRVREDGATPG